MAEEKDSQLLIAYFPTADEAHKAGESLKDWDKERKDIELGAMSIVTMDAKGEIKEDKVGARKTGKGAKWGLLAGAALGILSGGVTLIGGALVGLAAGALSGSFMHKDIGMTDEDQERLQKHLNEGHAALAVMMDLDEMESTIHELNKLGADVATYNVPQDVLEGMERMYKAGDVIRDRIDKDTSVEMAGEEPD